MKIIVQTKSVYGEDRHYPKCPLAKTFAEIAGTKTLTPHTLALVMRLGYEIEQPAPAAFTLGS